MFEVSAPEITLLAVIALLVLGPERLPTAARYLGLMVRKVRAQWFAVKDEVQRELAADELKRSLQRTEQALQDGAAAPNKPASTGAQAPAPTASDNDSAR